jgi:hypothetical protein
MNQVHTFPHYFPKIHCNIIFPSMLRSSQRFFPSGFPSTVFYTFGICLPCVLHALLVLTQNNKYSNRLKFCSSFLFFRRNFISILAHGTRTFPDITRLLYWLG